MQNAPLYLVARKQISSTSLLLFIIVCISNCQNKRHSRQKDNAIINPAIWNNATIDSTIAGNIIYRQMDKENEIFSMHEHIDSSMKRTSWVAYYAKERLNTPDSNTARFNNCRANIFRGDTLTINIGIGNGLGGAGFIITYKDKKFYTEPVYYDDVVTDEPDPVYEIVYQHLTLDKPVYKPGDSLYGNVDFKCIEVGADKSRIEHSGNGYFRTKVGQKNTLFSSKLEDQIKYFSNLYSDTRQLVINTCK
jgi:hypothetical protein